MKTVNLKIKNVADSEREFTIGHARSLMSREKNGGWVWVNPKDEEIVMGKQTKDGSGIKPNKGDIKKSDKQEQTTDSKKSGIKDSTS